MFVTAILLMGGKGERFGNTLPKQFIRLSGKELFLHTLEVFEKTHLFNEIILVCPKNWLAHVAQLVNPNIRLVVGGDTRQASSLAGIQASNPKADILVIHDAVRPFITKQILSENINGAKRYGAVDTCIPSTDTIVSGSATVQSIPDRTTLFRGQTPQSFQRKLIFQAHMTTKKTNATDDCQLVHELKKPIHIIQGSEANIKITSELDLLLAEQIIRMNTTPSPDKVLSLAGKKYVITGGTGGLGQAIARELASHNASSLLFSRSSKEYPVDLTDYQATKKAFESLREPIDGLINCVGYLDCSPLKQITVADINTSITTNFTSIVYACQLAPIKDGGHIINISSSSYSRGRKGYLLYSASKAAIVNFTQGLAEEYPHLSVNVLIPPRMNTQMRTQNFPDEAQDSLLEPSEVAKEIPSILSSHTTGLLYEIKKTRMASHPGFT